MKYFLWGEELTVPKIKFIIDSGRIHSYNKEEDNSSKSNITKEFHAILEDTFNETYSIISKTKD